MKNVRWDSVFAAVTLCFGIGIICYAVSRIDSEYITSFAETDSVVYVNAPADDETVIVLDAGHGGMS